MTVNAPRSAPQTSSEVVDAARTEPAAKPAEAPDAALQAIERQRQEAKVDSASKTEQISQELQDQVVEDATGLETVTPPTLPSTPAAAKEPKFLDSVLKYYDAAVARGKGPVGATLDTILYALTSGSTKLWDWVSGLLNGKKKDEKKEEKPAPAATPPAAPAAKTETAESKTFQDDLDALCKEFGITEKDDPKKKYFLVSVELGKEVEAKYGVPYKVCVGQACLESGFGTSDVVQRCFNSFGIMALGNYSGKKSGSYRAYDSLRDCFMGYGKLLSTSELYTEAFQHKNDPKRFLEEIKKAGYAEDPDYVSKVIGAAAVYDLSLSNANS